MKSFVRRASRQPSLVAVALLGLLAACSGGTADTEPEAEADEAAAETVDDEPDESDELTPVNITVTQWPSQLHSVPYVVAMENGYFEDEDLLVEGVVSSEGGGSTVRNLLTGGLDFAEASTSALATSYIAGAPVGIVGGGVQSVAEAMWVGLADSPYDSLESLVDDGGTIGYTNPGSVSQANLQLILEAAGYEPDEVSTQSTGGLGGGLTALESGGVDATLHIEPIFSGGPDPYKVLWYANDYLERVQATSIAVNPAFAEENPDTVRAFLRARARAIEFITDEPLAAAELYAEAAGIEVDAAHNAILQVLADEYWGIGFAEGGFELVAEAMRKLGEIGAEDEVPWDEFVDEAFLPN